MAQALAVRLAKDVDGLETLCEGLRHKMQQSPLTDATGFTRQLEAAYRRMWKKWCEKSVTSDEYRGNNAELP